MPAPRNGSPIQKRISGRFVLGWGLMDLTHSLGFGQSAIFWSSVIREVRSTLKLQIEDNKNVRVIVSEEIIMLIDPSLVSSQIEYYKRLQSRPMCMMGKNTLFKVVIGQSSS